MTRVEVDLSADELQTLRQAAERTGRTMHELIRAATRRVWIHPLGPGPIALRDGELRRSSAEHDGLSDET